MPGPGTYEPKNSINETGKYVMSNMHSTLSPSFSVPTFRHGGSGRSAQTDEVIKRNVPGPGSYQPKLNVGESIVFNSSYKSPTAKSFYHVDRFPNRSQGDRKNI